MAHFNIYYKNGNSNQQQETYLTADDALWAYLDLFKSKDPITELRIEKFDYRTCSAKDITAKVNKIIEKL